MLDILIPAVSVTAAFGAGAWATYRLREKRVRFWRDSSAEWHKETVRKQGANDRLQHAFDGLERKYLDLLGRAYVHDAKGRIKKASDVL